jgi:RNA polymerase sigma factor (sigma-70 family)
VLLRRDPRHAIAIAIVRPVRRGPTTVPTLEEDRALLDAYRKGDRSALAQVFRFYVEDVTRTIRAGVVVEIDGRRQRVGARLPEHEIEVLVQETFTRAFAPKAREAYDGLRPYGAWLATIARNLVIDRGRKELREQRSFVPVADADELKSDDVADPTWHLEEQQLRRIVDEMKASLGEPDKSIFMCRMEKQLSFREAANELSLSEIVVRRRDTRMRAELLERLRRHGFLEHAKVRIGASLLPRRGR